MFSGIFAAVPPELVRRCHVHFLKEKGRITRLPKDATPKFFFYTKTSSVFILIFIQKQRDITLKHGFWKPSKEAVEP